MSYHCMFKCLIVFLVLGRTFSITCPCQDPSSGAVWGPILEMDKCVSGCDFANQTERRSCQISLPPNPENTECVIVRSCPQAPCQGEWGAWGNAEICSNTCGEGKRKQTRSCYKKGTNNLLNNFCSGGFGSSTQERFAACRSISGCNNNRPRSIPPVTLPRETSAIKTTQPFTEEITKARNSLPNQVPEAFNVVTLGVVLGAVGFVCFSIIIVVIIVIIVKKKRPRRQNLEPSLPRHIHKQQQIERSDHDYEDVGPPLPPDRQGASSFLTINHLETPSQIPAAIYTQAGDEEGHQFNEGPYMEPMPSPANRQEFNKFEREIEVSEYVTVDQAKTQNY